MAAYRRVYDSRHLQADCQEPGSAPEPYAMGYLLVIKCCFCVSRLMRPSGGQWRCQDFVTGGSEVWVGWGSRVRSPPEADMITAVHRNL